MRGRTTFIIAHRLSTIKRANRILVIEGGRIAEQGSHSELLRLHGRYHRLYTRQYRSELESRYGVDEALAAAEEASASFTVSAAPTAAD